MPPGKAASQAGHAFLDSFLHASDRLQQTYLRNVGPKVVLVAPHEIVIRAIHDAALALNLPTSLVIDQHHILPPHFDGSPIVTAVGIGPATREQVRSITNGLKPMS